MNNTDNNLRPDHTTRSNFPYERTSFIGRKRELAYIEKLLNSNRLVTLTGTGGCGKTRIALRLATELDHVDGVYWIELASLADGSLLAQTIAKVLEIPQDAGRSSDEILIDTLKNEQMLLILDNCEHLLDACAKLIRVLLSETQVSILATSREALQVTGEQVYPLQPMAIPSDDNQEPTQFDAIQLFVVRAQSLVPAFELNESNAAAIVGICQRLDGIPLAIELAAARTNILSVEQIAGRLDDRFRLLPRDTHLIDSQHRGLRAAIDWSYDLLSPPEQTLLRRLSVFQGGCSISTIEKVCVGDGIEQYEVLDLLSSLVSKSLLIAQTSGVDAARYSLLETIREYAYEKLIASGESDKVHNHHMQVFLELTEETEPKLQGEYQQLWLNWMESEFNNIRAALTWALQQNHIEIGFRIAIACYQLWTVRDYVEEGLYWYEGLLAQIEEDSISPLVHAKGLTYAATMSGFRGNIKKQLAYGRLATQVAETAGEEGKEVLAWALGAQAYGARAEGDFETEFELAMRATKIHRELDNRYLLAVSLSTSSFSAMSVGKYDVAHAMLDEALPMLREMDNPYRVAMALNFSGDLARCEKNYREARIVYEESISILRDINAVRDLASVYHNLGHVYLHLGEVETATNLFTESMNTHESQNNRAGMAECLLGFAALAITRQKVAMGVRLLSGILAIRGQPATAMWAATRMDYEYYLALAQERLTTEAFENQQAIGRRLSLEEALTQAQEIADDIVSHSPPRDLDDLTERELEVVVLIAQAKSNGEIADDLVLSKRTVEKHIANIRSKLGFNKRTEIVRFAMDNNLLESDI